MGTFRKIVVDDVGYCWDVREDEEWYERTLKVWRADLGGGQRAVVIKSRVAGGITPAEVADWVRTARQDGWDPEIGGAPLVYDLRDATPE